MAGRKSMLEDDDGWGSSKGDEVEMELDITPMIDVTFLLLIFFMVTSTMKPNTELDVPPAKHGVGVDSGAAALILVKSAGESETPIIEVNGIEASLDEVRQFVDQGISAGKTQVIVKAHREVPHGFVQEVIKVVAEFEGVKFAIGVRDKR